MGLNVAVTEYIINLYKKGHALDNIFIVLDHTITELPLRMVSVNVYLYVPTLILWYFENNRT